MTASIIRIRRAEDLDSIVFEDGVAALEVPIELLPRIRLKNHRRQPSDRLDAVKRSIRAKGWSPMEPIVARLSRKGKWVILDGGHRITALREFLNSLACRWFGVRLCAVSGSLYVILHDRPKRLRAKKSRRGKNSQDGENSRNGKVKRVKSARRPRQDA